MIISYLYLYLKYEEFQDYEFQNMIMIVDLVHGMFLYLEYQLAPDDHRRNQLYGIMVPQPIVMQIVFFMGLAIAKLMGWTHCFYATAWIQENFIKLGFLFWSIDVSFFHDPTRPLYFTILALTFLCFFSKSTEFYSRICTSFKFVKEYLDMVLDNPTIVLFITYIYDIINNNIWEMDITPPLDNKPREDVFWIGEYNFTVQSLRLRDHFDLEKELDSTESIWTDSASSNADEEGAPHDT